MPEQSQETNVKTIAFALAVSIVQRDHALFTTVCSFFTDWTHQQIRKCWREVNWLLTAEDRIWLNQIRNAS